MSASLKKIRYPKSRESEISEITLPQKLILDSTITIPPRNGTPRGLDSFALKEINTRKRMLDILFSSVAAILLVPLLPIVAIIIKASSKGPVFFKQLREGKGGKPFVCYKFRSMHVSKTESSENGLPRVTHQKDERIFKFGQFMRQNNIDEIPQLLNVIKGEMSLSGPRPYMISECAHWKTVFDDFSIREKIRPGMSGLAQVNGYRGGSLCKKHMRTRLSYDLIYVKSYNVWVDIKIIGRTILQMLRLKTGAR